MEQIFIAIIIGTAFIYLLIRLKKSICSNACGCSGCEGCDKQKSCTDKNSINNIKKDSIIEFRQE